MNISQLVSVINQNPWLILCSLILNPVTIILSIIFFIKNKKTVSIKYCLKNDLLISDFIQKINNLNIDYSGNIIKTLSIAKIAIWNDGNLTINNNDFAKKDNFFISIDNDFEILDTSIIQTINTSNDIKVELSNDKKKIAIAFDYLDKKEGFVIQLFHTGTNIKIFNFEGSLKGFGKISKGKLQEKPKLHTVIKELLPLLSGLIIYFLSSLFSYEINIVLIIFSMILIWFSIAFIIYRIFKPVPMKFVKYFVAF